MTVPNTPAESGERRGRLAPARLTEQFVLMEEPDVADAIKAQAAIMGVSYAEVIRQCIRHGGLAGVHERYEAELAAWEAARPAREEAERLAAIEREARLAQAQTERAARDAKRAEAKAARDAKRAEATKAKKVKRTRARSS
jgi:hypothetical protein